MGRKGFLIALIMFIGVAANAGEIYSFYNGIRDEAMGGAAIATVDDETALLLNPAAMGKLRDNFFTLVDPQVDADTQAIKTNSGNWSSATDIQSLLNQLNKSPGSHYHLKASLFPSVVLPNFGFGLIAQTSEDADVDPTGTNFDLNYRQDVGAVLGYNLRFWGGRLKVGANVRTFDRVEVDQTFSANTTNLQLNKVGTDGWAVASDGGVILTAPWRFLPTLSAVVRDIGGTSFGLGQGMFFNSDPNRPEYVRQTVNVGAAIFPILANHTRMSLTVEMDDLSDPDPGEQTYPIRRLHAGGELNFSDFLFLRGGCNQGFWTAGVEFATTNFQIQATSYGEDIGTPGKPEEDRRYMGKFVFRF